MEDTNKESGVSNENQSKPGMRPIDVAYQITRVGMQTILELSAEGERLPLEKEQDFRNLAQKILDVLTPHTEETSKNPQANSETLSPTWFEELKAKVESGEIPKFAGKWHDGDPIEFLKQHYKIYLDAKVLTQAHLKDLDWKLYDCLNNSYRGARRNILNGILPPLLSITFTSIN